MRQSRIPTSVSSSIDHERSRRQCCSAAANLTLFDGKTTTGDKCTICWHCDKSKQTVMASISHSRILLTNSRLSQACNQTNSGEKQTKAVACNCNNNCNLIGQLQQAMRQQQHSADGVAGVQPLSHTSLICSRAAAPCSMMGTVKTGVGTTSVLKDCSGRGYTCSVIRSCTCSAESFVSCPPTHDNMTLLCNPSCKHIMDHHASPMII